MYFFQKIYILKKLLKTRATWFHAISEFSITFSTLYIALYFRPLAFTGAIQRQAQQTQRK